MRRGKRVADQLEAGGVMINEVANTFDYPQVPAGGFKQSGIGREVGVYVLEEYLQTQSVYGKTSEGATLIFSIALDVKILENVIRYIENQEEHHKRVTFQDEYRAFLKAYGIAYHERYVWD
jgi:hypothetical protein